MFSKATQVKNLDKIPAFGTLDDSPRGRVLRAAAHLFRVQGYAGTTVREIAALVGIQSGSLFHHFRSKEEILFVVMREIIVYNTVVLQEVVEGITDPRTKLRAVIQAELNAINGITRDAMTVLVFEWGSVSREHKEQLESLRQEYEEIWIKALAGSGLEETMAGSPSVRRSLLRGAIAWTATWYRRDGSISIEGLADIVLGMALGGAV
ncbi:TetR family transcriptional regulator [Fluviicoccus keumensis]|uniref:TetR family transcriptional regulator n=1 Tax=Fluviicoccus keumensis TaxID=1435465 RepID=A0A4Q7Z8J8_9GAMM|nr:TetR/AcrR family transcriptional regulator [Fluviicoccus keumensis]RZU46837.1 TetR family transcriptional regulator [Fluviicoccus keumensis]